MTRIERAAPFLDDKVIAVQDGADAWCEEPGFSGRVWCNLSIRYADAIAPDGWFFLYEGIGNRKTNIGRGQCPGIVQPVSKHGDMAALALQRFDPIQFLMG